MTNTQKQQFYFLGTLCLLAVFLFKSDAIIAAASNALLLSARTILPALFPFLVLSGILCAAAIDLPLPGGRLFRRFFRLPEVGIVAFLLGALCGFPIGVKVTAELFRSGKLQEEEAARLAAFSANTGPAFAVAGIGCGLFGDPSLGWKLYLTQLLSAVLLGFFSARRMPSPRESMIGKTAPLTIDLPDILASASHTMVTTVGTIVFFGCLSSLPALFLPAEPSALVTALLEVGNGSAAAAALPRRIGVPLTAFALSFSGFSVLMQSATLLSPYKISSAPLFKRKLAQGILSALILLPLT